MQPSAEDVHESKRPLHQFQTHSAAVFEHYQGEGMEGEGGEGGREEERGRKGWEGERSVTLLSVGEHSPGELAAGTQLLQQG